MVDLELILIGGAFSQPVEAFDGKKWDEDRFAAAPGEMIDKKISFKRIIYGKII